MRFCCWFSKHNIVHIHQKGKFYLTCLQNIFNGAKASSAVSSHDDSCSVFLLWWTQALRAKVPADHYSLGIILSFFVISSKILKHSLLICGTLWEGRHNAEYHPSVTDFGSVVTQILRNPLILMFLTVSKVQYIVDAILYYYVLSLFSSFLFFICYCFSWAGTKIHKSLFPGYTCNLWAL